MTVNSVPHKPKRKAPPGAWKPGQSGNPSGRPRSPKDFLENEIGRFAAEAFRFHIAVMRGEVSYGADKTDRIAKMRPEEIAAMPREFSVPTIAQRQVSATVLIEHTVGKPTQPLEQKHTIDVSVDLDRLSDEALLALMSAAKMSVIDSTAVVTNALPSGTSSEPKP